MPFPSGRIRYVTIRQGQQKIKNIEKCLLMLIQVKCQQSGTLIIKDTLG